MSDPAELYASLGSGEMPWWDLALCAQVDRRRSLPGKGRLYP